MWKMLVRVILIVVGALGTVPKVLEKKTEGIRNHRKKGDHPDYSIVTQFKYSEESWWPVETCSHSDSNERPSFNAEVKN